MYYSDYNDPEYGRGQIAVVKYASNGHVGVLTWGLDDEPWRKLTVNFDDVTDQQIVVNGNEDRRGVYALILKNAGVIETLAPVRSFGVHDIVYPVYDLSHVFLEWLSKQAVL